MNLKHVHLSTYIFLDILVYLSMMERCNPWEFYKEGKLVSNGRKDNWKPDSQAGIEPKNSVTQIKCSTHWATGTYWRARLFYLDPESPSYI